MITLGGDADFEMVDTYDPFTEGIQFKYVRQEMRGNVNNPIKF